MKIDFDRSLEAPYGVAEKISAHVMRLLAPNPSLFTFKGTGVYIVGSGVRVNESSQKETSDVAVIDPGPDLPAHIEALKSALKGRRVSHILITHTHADHSPASVALKRWSGARIYGFGPHAVGPDDPKVEEGVDREFFPDHLVKDGDMIKGEGFTFDCIHTPGHTSNHMCYYLREENALFTGDHVMGWSTSVIAPPDGNMGDYIASLKKLLARDDAIFYPTHGSPIPAPKKLLKAYLDHRLAREAQIVACLRKGAQRIPEIVALLYADVDPRLHAAAARSVLAHLFKLVDEGRVTIEPGPDARYQLVTSLR